MSRLIYVTPPIGQPPRGGRAMLSDVHRRCLAELFGDGFELFELPAGRASPLGALAGRIDGVTKAAEQALIERLPEDGILFLNGSNLGRLARAAKRARPRATVISFFHNVEARFFRGALRERPSIRGAAVLLANLVAERMAARRSDRRIMLSERDARLIERLYGRGATDLLPMALDDQYSGTTDLPPEAPPGPYLLFVGGGFYANRAGIRWFALKVAPRVDLPTVVIGHGLDDLRAELERGGTVKLVGAVDRLEPWYRGASALIAPIFDGSGMKTKVAEALMFGKRVIGTPEAFAGYEDVAAEAGTLCSTADEFVAAIETMTAPAGFHPRLRLLFERHYSLTAACDRLAAMLGLNPAGANLRNDQ